MYYAYVEDGTAQAERIDDSARFAADAPNPAQVVTVDELNRSHVIFAAPFDEKDQEGTWYLVGPAY